jgi:hypothetical protein
MSEDTRIERTIVESRPDASGQNVSRFPLEWGTPPPDQETRAAWIRRRIAEGREAVLRGEPAPSWLAPEQR